MKIAIIGAGLSGLTCALEFQKHGITPDIFEKKSTVGDALDYTLVNMKVFDKFLGSPMRYLKRNYGIQIKPIGKLKKIIMISPKKQTVARGNLGYIFYKGEDERSLENQLIKYLRIPIIFDTHITALKIKNQYDYVIDASGDCSTAKQFNTFKSTFNGHSRIASIIGNFDVSCLKMWVNTEYCKSGYVYVLPYSKERANLVVSINNITYRDVDYYWNKFLKTEDIDYTIIETRDLEHNLGIVSPSQVGNIYMVGNAGGCMDSCMGFGFIAAIESGVLAARAIINNLDYNKMMQTTLKDVRLKHEYRKMFNAMNNNDYDKLLTILDLPVLKQLIYRNPLYKAAYPAALLKIYNDFTGKSN